MGLEQMSVDSFRLIRGTASRLFVGLLVVVVAWGISGCADEPEPSEVGLGEVLDQGEHARDRDVAELKSTTADPGGHDAELVAEGCHPLIGEVVGVHDDER